MTLKTFSIEKLEKWHDFFLAVQLILKLELIQLNLEKQYIY